MTTLNTIKMLAVVGSLMAGMFGVGAWVVSDLATVKSSVETVARQQAAQPVSSIGYAHK